MENIKTFFLKKKRTAGVVVMGNTTSSETHYRDALVLRRQRLLDADPRLGERFPPELFETATGLALAETQIKADEMMDDDDRDRIELWRTVGRMIVKELECEPTLIEKRDIFTNPVPDDDGTFRTVELQPGDHVMRTRVFHKKSPFTHHAVYIGDGFVVEADGALQRKDLGYVVVPAELSTKKQGKIDTVPGGKLHIRIETMDSFLESARRNNAQIYRIDHETRRARIDTVRIAVGMIGAWRYNIFESNCEVFTGFCVRNVAESEQATLFKSMIAAPVTRAMNAVASTLAAAAAPEMSAAAKYNNSSKKKVAASYPCDVTCNNVDTCHVVCPDQDGEKVSQRLDATRVKLMAEELMLQKSLGQPYHDPITGAYLAVPQVNAIRNTYMASEKEMVE